MSQSLKLFAIGLACFFTQSCARDRTLTFQSPSGKAAVDLFQRRIIRDAGARIELVSAGRRTVLANGSGETLISLVHVYWSPDEKQVGIVVTGLVFLELAADVNTGATIPFEKIRKDVADSIRKTYRVPAEEKDPVSWARMYDAQEQFAMMYPHFRDDWP